jgi:hypothetical protein
MVVHTNDDTTHQFLPMEEGGKALTRGITSALQKLKQMAQLPDEDTLINMRDVDIDAQNADIAEVTQGVTMTAQSCFESKLPSWLI